MPYTYILDDSIKSPTLILTADHSTLLFLPGSCYKIKNSFFLLWVNLYMITDTYWHDPSPFNGPVFMTPPFSAVSKSCDPPSVSTPLPPANFWQVPYFHSCLVFFYFDILSLIEKKNILGFSVSFLFSFQCFFVFRAGRFYIAWRVLCSLGISRMGCTPLFGLDGYVPQSSAWFSGSWIGIL